MHVLLGPLTFCGCWCAVSILDSPLLKTFDKLHLGCVLHRLSNPPRISLLIRVRVGLPGWDPPPGPFPGPGPGCKCEVARRVAAFIEGLKAAAVKTGVGPRRGAFRDLSKVFRHGLSKIEGSVARLLGSPPRCGICRRFKGGRCQNWS